MPVNGVSQRPDALLQQSALPGRDTRAGETAPRAESPPPVERSEPAEPAESRRVEPPEPPRPVVNTQGQTTGTRINTTA